MIVTSTYSPWLRARLTQADWDAVLASGPGEVRFGRGVRGVFTCELRDGSTVVHASHPTSPRLAFDAGLRDLRRAGIVSVLRG